MTRARQPHEASKTKLPDVKTGKSGQTLESVAQGLEMLEQQGLAQKALLLDQLDAVNKKINDISNQRAGIREAIRIRDEMAAEASVEVTNAGISVAQREEE